MSEQLSVAVPETGFAEAPAICPNGGKAIGFRASARQAQAIQSLQFIIAVSARIWARRAMPIQPNMNVVAFCMTMP